MTFASRQLSILSTFVRRTFVGFTKRAEHRWHQPREACLQNVIGGANLEGFNRNFFAQCSRDENEGHIRASIFGKPQCGETIERGKCIVRQNQINVSIKRIHEARLSINSY